MSRNALPRHGACRSVSDALYQGTTLVVPNRFAGIGLWLLAMSKPLRNASCSHSVGKLAGLFLLASALSHTAVGQQIITLRFVDYQTGKPISNIRVTGFLWNGASMKSAARHQGVMSKVSTRTTADGTITIPIPSSTPEHLTISSIDTIDQLSTDLLVSQVLTTGLAVQADADNTVDWKLMPAVSPGEVVIITRKLTARDRTP